MITQKFKWDPLSVPLDDPKVWRMLSRGFSGCTFQLEKALGQKYSEIIKPQSIEELSDLITLIRPGCLENKIDGVNIPRIYANRKNLGDPVVFQHPDLEPILKNTYGLMLTQEQAMKIAQDLAGFSGAESDKYIRKCVAWDSILLTMSGPRSIKELSNNKSASVVMTVDYYGKRKWKKISNIWKSGYKKIYELNTVNGFSVRCTHDHRIFTNHGWKELKDITSEDYVCVPNRSMYEGDCRDKTSTALAELLGYFLGEGCYTDKCDPKITNSDEWILERCKTNLISEFGDNSFREKIHKNGVVDLILKEEAKRFFESGFEKLKSRNKKVTKIIQGLKPEALRAYVGSFISGEASISVKERNVIIHSTSRRMQKYMQHFLMREGIHGSLTTKKGKYKGNRYYSYDISICDPKEIVLMVQVYGEYICPSKLKKIKDIAPVAKSNSKFLIPGNFIRPVVKNYNLNRLGIKSDQGGSIYTGPLTYDRASYLNQYIFSDVLEEVLNYDFRFVKVSSVLKLGKQEVYDFSMEDEDCEWAFVDNILVHNSIGKKIPELMAKAETMFYKGTAKNNIDIETSKKIFEGILKSQRYSFNASHSYAYALNNYYYSAYPKAHYPLPFFCVQMDHAHDANLTDLEALSVVIDEAMKVGIYVIKPDIRYFNDEFKVLRSEILFGMARIRNVSAKCIKGLREKYPKIAFMGWDEMLLTVFQDLTIRQGESLIMSGAFDWLKKPRSQMLHDLGVVKSKDPSLALNDREKQFLLESEMSIRDGLQYLIDNPETTIEVPLTKVNAKSKKSIAILEEALLSGEKPVEKKKVLHGEAALFNCKRKLFRLNHPHRKCVDSIRRMIQWESHVLGRAFTFDKIDLYGAPDGDCTCQDLQRRNVPTKKTVTLPVIVNDVREYTDYNTPRKMCYFKGSDSTGIFQSFKVPPEVYGPCKSILQDGEPVMISGSTFANKYGERTFQVDSINQL